MSWIKWLKKTKLVTASPEDTVLDSVKHMVDRGVGSILVVEEGQLVGIFSERDVLARVLAAGKDPATTSVGDVCTRQPKVVREDSELEECAKLIRGYGFRHVPVVDMEGRPTGILSVRDFLHYVLEELETLIERAYREKRIEQLTDPYSMVAGDLDD